MLKKRWCALRRFPLSAVCEGMRSGGVSTQTVITVNVWARSCLSLDGCAEKTKRRPKKIEATVLWSMFIALVTYSNTCYVLDGEVTRWCSPPKIKEETGWWAPHGISSGLCSLRVHGVVNWSGAAQYVRISIPHLRSSLNGDVLWLHGKRGESLRLSCFAAAGKPIRTRREHN